MCVACYSESEVLWSWDYGGTGVICAKPLWLTTSSPNIDMPTILVTGAASGIGAAFVQAYQAESGNKIIAVDRQNIAHSHNVEAISVDVGDEESVQALAHQLKDRPLDLVIHSAGVRGLVPGIELSTPGNVAACETMDVMDAETLTKTLRINTVGTFLLLRAIVPNVRLTSGKVVVMSSRMVSAYYVMREVIELC